MKNEPLQNPLRELVWRRKLTDAERAGLGAQPEVQADLEIESRLSETLARLPDAPVPSNFTARVLQAVERESVRPRAINWSWTWRMLVLVAEAQPLPSVDALKNFNAIQRMSQPRADDELLVLLQ